MKVIFTDNVKDVAARGDIKNVRPGYFRNYLFPFNKAILATDGSLAQWETLRKQILIEKEQMKSKMEEVKSRLEGKKLSIEKKATKKGTLYGGIKAADVVKAVKSEYHVEVPTEAVTIKGDAKVAGGHTVTLKLADGVETTLMLEVVGKE